MRPIRFPFMLFLIASAAIVGTALGSQYLGGLDPCELCLLERWPYYIAIIVSAFGFAASGHRAPRRYAMWLIVLLFAVSTCLGAYHVAVEQHWVAGPTACTGGIGGASSPDQLLKMLQARQPVQCDVVQWSIFGISLAGMNFIASIVLAMFGFVMARRGDAA
ncbi:MAG TPA: disulfide bond formation protein B [Stellaceae bacterium]|jgi:disulfide bond formation protein DsbB|nr:disulfide bond formation protein B [Stellaceae bacterium]